MKTLLAFLAILLCCPFYGQNIEHQIVASQFGNYRVPTVGNGFAFPPDSCQVSGGGRNFPAFVAGVPVKIVDANPAQIEVVTPVAVNLNNSNCSVSMTTSFQHSSFYLTSGTGGLQEALNSGQVTGGANTVILDQQWYSLVAPSNPATVIGAVHGSTALGLIDVTTTPYTGYTWSGSAYVMVAPPGGLPSGSGIVKVASSAGQLAIPGTDYALPNANTTGTAGNLAGTPALPAGTTATTQATGPCDNSGKLATDQFVVACAGTASFPASPQIVFNTSNSASRNATSSDITNLLGYTPAAGAPVTAGTASGTTYYVDNVNGLDSNNGTSKATAWKTIAHVNAQTFSSNSQILFLSTDVWHEQLTVPSSSVTIGAYGPQRNCTLNSALVAYCINMPIIDGADVVTGWTVQSGTTYEAAYTSTASKGFVDSLYTQTSPLALQTSIANVNSTAGSIYSDGVNVYVHLLDGSNPGSHVVEVSGSRKYGIFLQGQGSVTVNGVEIIRTAKSGYLSWGNSGATGNSNIIENSVLFNSGDSLGDSALGGQIEAGIMEMASATDTNVTGFQAIYNWVGQMDFPHASPNFALNGIYAAGLAGPVIKFNKIATGNNFALHAGDWFTNSHGTCSAPVIASNEIVNSEGNIFIAGCPNSVIQYNYVHDSFGNGIEIGTGVNSSVLSTAPYVGFNTIKHMRPAFSNTLYNGIDVNYAINGVATGNIVSDVANDELTLEADVSPSSGWILTGNRFDASQNTYFDGTAPSNSHRVYPLYIRDTSLTGFSAAGNTLYVNAASPFIQYGATSSSDTTHDVSLPIFDQSTNFPNANSLTVANQVITPVLTAAQMAGSADSYASIQAAFTQAQANCVEVYIPPGTYTTSAGLTYNANCVRIRGGGGGATTITASAGTYNVLTVGTGNGGINVPSGYIKDLYLSGAGKPGSETGFSCVQLNGILKFVVENVQCANQDIGIDFINNDYGAVIYNFTANGGLVNVGINLPTGSQSGSDITFISPWVEGTIAAVSMTSGGGGYHFYGGQLNINAGSACDTCGVLIMGKDYKTGSTTNLGATGADLHATSFENPNAGWGVRAFNPTVLQLDHVPMFVYSSLPLGFYKNTAVGNSQLDFKDIFIAGPFTNTDSGCPLISLPNGWGTGAMGIESNTTTQNSNLTLCGVSTAITSMAAQSNQLGNFMVLGDQNGRISLPGSTSGLILANDGTGKLETSANGGSTYNPLLSLPGSSAAYDFLYTNTIVNNLARLAANTTANDAVVTSTGAAQASPTTQTCSGSNGSGTSAVCTWSAPVTTGQRAVCNVFTLTSSPTFTVTDSASNTYTADGSVFAAFGSMQTFYSAASSGSVTTTTVSLGSTSSGITIQCNASSNLAASSPTDGQCTGSSAGTPVSCGSALTTSVNGDYLMCATSTNNNGITVSPEVGWTLGSQLGGQVLSQYLVQTSAGAITPSVAWAGGVAGVMMQCSAFKPGATITAGPPTLKNAPALSTSNMLATALKSGTSSNSDSVGVLTLSGGTQTYTFTGTYATAPVCFTQDRTTPANASHAATSTTVLTVTGTGTDAVGYICMGLN